MRRSGGAGNTGRCDAAGQAAAGREHRRGGAAARLGRGAHHLLRWLASIAAVLILVAGFGLWRLMQGPIALDRLTPYVEAALNRSAGGFKVAISGVRFGIEPDSRRFDLQIDGVRLARPDGEPLAAFPEIRAGFDLGSLLRGRLAPSDLVIVRPVLRLVREADGTVRFRLGGGRGEAADFPRQILEPAQRGEPAPFVALRRIVVRGARLILDDRQTGRRWQADRVDAVVRRTAGGLAGDLSLALPIGGGAPELHADYRYDAARRRLDLSAEFGAFEPAALASLDPALRPLAAIRLPVSGSVVTRIDLDPLRAEGGRVDLVLGKGRLANVALPQGSLGIEGGELHATYAPESGTLRLAELALDLGGGSMLTATGTLDRLAPALIAGVAPPPGQAAGPIPGKLAIVLSNLPLARFESLWPRPIGRGGRRWALANLHGGVIDTATIRLGLAIDPAARMAEIVSTRGSMRYHDVTVDYFDGLTPVRQVAGTATLSGKTLEFTPSAGRIRSVRVTGGSLRISNLGGETEWLAIDLAIAGPVRDVLDVIDEKPLHYASAIGLDPSRVAGHLTGTLKFKLPLLKDLKFADVDYDVKARLADVAIAGLVRGGNLADGGFTLAIARDGLQLRGKARLDGVPATIEASRRFAAGNGGKDGPQTRYRIAVTLDDAARRRLLGDGLRGRLAGPVGVDLAYTGFAGGHAEATALLDLGQAQLSIPEAGWQKPPDVAASARLDLALDGDRVTGLPRIEIEAPKLDGRLAVILGPEGRQIARIDIARLAIAGTELSGTVTRGAEGGWRVDVHGRRADLGPWLQTLGKADVGESRGVPPALTIDARFARVVLGPHGELRDVVAQLSRGRAGWQSARLDARLADGHALRLRFGGGVGRGRLSLRSDDLGATLAALGVTDNVVGGRVRVTGTLAEAKGETILSGHVEGADYHLVGAPAFAKVLSLASFSAVASMLSGSGIPFTTLRGDFAYRGGRITLKDFLAYGGAIGVTAEGSVEPRRDRLDLHGTLVPAYTLNSLIGNVPVIGSLLLGGKGEGLFAASYTVAGSSADPQVTVNPLSALAPGFLRGLMNLKPGISQPHWKAESKAGY